MLRKVIGNSFGRLKNAALIQNIITRNTSIYEPDYLELMKPKFPIVCTVNIQIKGHDFPILENYQKFVHNVADQMDLDVADGWAQPPQNFKVQKFKPSSAITDAEYDLKLYERNIQVADIQSPYYPLLLRILQEALPEGVTMNIIEHTDEIETQRYVPDKDLNELKKQLDDMGGPSKKKK